MVGRSTWDNTGKVLGRDLTCERYEGMRSMLFVFPFCCLQVVMQVHLNIGSIEGEFQSETEPTALNNLHDII